MVTTEELLKLLKEIAEERIPFNKVLGLTVQTMDEEQMQVKFDMRDELVGNFMRGNLHGGVISSVLDLVGGMNAWLGVMKQIRETCKKFFKFFPEKDMPKFLGVESNFIEKQKILLSSKKDDW
ncbi:MAG: hypothetical protein VX759_09575, partial [SAR324 cluster bacterium]|nr:hypothetical protein [SAR324 cluster bacterium]